VKRRAVLHKHRCSDHGSQHGRKCNAGTAGGNGNPALAASDAGRRLTQQPSLGSPAPRSHSSSCDGPHAEAPAGGECGPRFLDSNDAWLAALRKVLGSSEYIARLPHVCMQKGCAARACMRLPCTPAMHLHLRVALAALLCDICCRMGPGCSLTPLTILAAASRP
jgi:hypothetical protein